ncbi:hypothetical protein ATO8_18105 [Roseivivax marinus]|uniref:Phage integrase n=1 Tax=Roseivivax marinus TaxID=1379903 RepID=W4HFR8_9RHOB|nr:hypothetical protein [Roseivivax marinus]ETW11243.1 hypothetical protein ATO8_18105 [Roseivivax marinus]
MTARQLEPQLTSLPDNVRNAILADRRNLRPGMVPVLKRFFAALRRRGEAPDAPSTAPFRAAARSEATLYTLLRALTRYAPHVPTTAGYELRREYYRLVRAAHIDRTKSSSSLPLSAPEDWPEPWRRMWPGLRAAPIRDTSKRRYHASICRCANVIPELALPHPAAAESPGYLFGIAAGEVFRRQGLVDRTIASYLGGLEALMRHGEGDEHSRNALCAVRDHYTRSGRGQPKAKTARVVRLVECGGFEHVVSAIGNLVETARHQADHTAQACRLRQAAAILAVAINKPARSGDMGRWRLGKELQRDPHGTWRLAWTQEKTGVETGAGELWPETGMVLDELLLCGLPRRVADAKYRVARGLNWLTQTNGNRRRPWVSGLVREVIGVPLHDLRTLAADYMRWTAPDTAADVIQSHLGHGSRQAGAAYRALSDSDAAAEAWREMRDRIGSEG